MVKAKTAAIGAVAILVVLALFGPSNVIQGQFPSFTDRNEDDDIVHAHLVVERAPKTRVDFSTVLYSVNTRTHPEENVRAFPWRRNVTIRRSDEVALYAYQNVDEWLRCTLTVRDSRGNVIHTDQTPRSTAGSVRCYYNRASFLDPK